MASERYLALIGDVVGSRDRADRARLQASLVAALGRLNDAGTSAVRAADFDVVAGDAVEGLFVDPFGGGDPEVAGRVAVAVVDAIRILADAVHPARIVFGLACGPLDIGPAGGSTPIGRLDGPCFHDARAGLEHAQRNRVWAWLQSPQSAGQVGWNALVELIGVLRDGWTARQKELVELARCHDQQREVAAVLDVSPSVVSEGLAAAHYQPILRAERAAARLLAEVLRPGAPEASV